MDLFLRNGRNGDFFTKWSYKIRFYSLSGTIFCVNIKVRHAYHLIVLFQVFQVFLSLYLNILGFFSLRNGVSVYEMELKYLISNI